MINADNKKTFYVSVGEFLSSCCNDDEKVLRTTDDLFNQTHCIMFTKTGVHKLSIPKNTYIDALYLSEASELPVELSKYSLPRQTVVFVNMSERYFQKDQKTKLIKIFYAPELLKSLKFNKKDYRVKEPIFSIDEFYKERSLHFEKTAEFINYVIRCKIVYRFLSTDRFIDPSKVIARPGQKSVFPFLYERSSLDAIIFFEDKRGLENPFYSKLVDSKNAKLIKLFIDDKKEFLIMRYSEVSVEDGDVSRINYTNESARYEFDKLHKIDLTNHIELFNKIYGSFYIDDFIDLFKYRKFEKTRYDNDQETVAQNPSANYLYPPESEEIEIGSRGALEDRAIWFSSYEQLNDPFDLLIKKPKKGSLHEDLLGNLVSNEYEQIQNKGYLTFCVTSREDNILMWSHYGYSHKGICTSYPMIDILKAIENDPQIGICFYGKIDYQPNPVPFSIPKTIYRFLGADVVNLWFSVSLMFNKYSDWKYENEFRFLIYPNETVQADFSKGHLVNLPFKKLYLGFGFPLAAYKNYLSKLHYSYNQFKLSLTEYKLEI